MLAKVSELVLPAIERSGPIEAWIIAICPRIGPRIRHGGTRPGCRRQFLSKPSPRSPLSRSKRPARRGYPKVWC